MKKTCVLEISVLLFLSVLSNLAYGKPAKKVLVVGVDGLDPKLLQTFLDQGELPNFKRMIAQGDFKPLQTSMPPLSPVAWSTFITGMTPGGHGIFDFLHRDPKTLEPYLSMSRALPPGKTFRLGSVVIPLTSGKVEQLRKGRTFWQILEDHGVPTTIFRIPANFPPAESKGRSLSGMGTPDILGTPGTFSYYTDDPPKNADEISGGVVRKVRVINNRVDGQLVGPRNTFRVVPAESSTAALQEGSRYEHPELVIDFTAYLDPEEAVAKFVVTDREFILKQGEWSDWVRVDFQALPLLVNISAVARFYLQAVRPHFKLYVSPLQINPEDPAMPISTPSDWSSHLCDELDYFYTQELPEDTKAFSAGVLSGEEFWTQAQLVYSERRKALRYLLREFKEGLLFFYFSSVDQGCHMLWKYMDEKHPAYEAGSQLADGIKTIYSEIDEAMGLVLDVIDDDTTLIVMSDHGFAPFYWGVNLNTWLLEKGYVKLKKPSEQGQHPLFTNVDWSQTRAYALGLNGLYVNLKGRESRGIVAKGREYDLLVESLERDLLAMRDRRNGEQVVTLVTRTHRDFPGPYVDIGPDIIVGYNRGYRSSWDSPLGRFPREVFVDNNDPWSGDHSMDYRFVPGVLISNQRITMEAPALQDLTVAILDEYGVKPLEVMHGKDCLGPRAGKSSEAVPESK